MGNEIIIDAKVNKFKEINNYKNVDENTVFEIFVNQLIVENFHQGNFDISDEYLDSVNVGGGDDTGIDGIAFVINNSFVFTKKDVDMLIRNNTSIKVEMVFIQAKNRLHIDKGEFGLFLSGIKDFVNQRQYEPSNDKIKEWLELKNYIFTPDKMSLMSGLPTIKAYYVYKGEFIEKSHIESKINEFKNDISNIGSYGSVNVLVYDGESLLKEINKNENSFESTIEYSDSFELESAPNVKSSTVLFCSAANFLHLLADDNQMLRRGLFQDNVRDYQGETIINKEIMETIKNNPSSFCLLNNGITIVSRSSFSMNRKMNLINPQIVNGCQTCSTLYRAWKDGLDISKINLIIKIISTDDMNVVNAVVKGTNRQNIVYDEVFEITRDFHKKLEEYTTAIQKSIPENKKIYYERRSRQLVSFENIPLSRVFNLRILTQSYVSTFLCSPHRGFEREVYLLEEFHDKIFNESDDYYPYFISSLLYLRLDALFKAKFEKYKNYSRFRFQIMSLFINLNIGRIPSQKNRKNVIDYCEKARLLIENESSFEEAVSRSVNRFSEIVKKWVQSQGQGYTHGIKDSAKFDSFMFEEIGIPYNKEKGKLGDDKLMIGKVLTVKKDRNGLYYGFIEASPVDVYIHEDDNERTRFNTLEGKYVKYYIYSIGLYNNPRGRIVKVVTNEE